MFSRDNSALGRLLATFCLQGLISLEDLDSPSSGWEALEAARAAANRRAMRTKLPPPYFPGLPWRNLAREWIAAHPAEWEAMLIKTLNDEPNPIPAHPLHGL